MDTVAIVLAAGASTRMKSKKPKVAHEMLGKPLVRWVIDAVHEAGVDQVLSVVGHMGEQVIPIVEDDSQVIVQPERNGTAGAVLACAEVLADFNGSLVVLSGDCPLITADTIKRLIEEREHSGSAVVALTMELENPFGYGRIVRESDGTVERIVEQRDANSLEAAIKECNAGFYCFDARMLFDALSHVDDDNAQGELYLTDVLEICRSAGHKVSALLTDDPTECLGVNSRAQLADACRIAQQRINARHMAEGVTIWSPDQAWIGPDVVIERDVELLPQTYLLGKVSIAEGSVIGPNTRLTDTTVGHGCTVDETVAVESTIDDDVTCGPRVYLRPGTHLCDGSKAGTHVEIKKSTVGKNSKVPHLSYIGDATIGENVNIGAGSITCNYDGASKHKTVIGDRAFIGSDTMLVAPVKVGADAIVGAGSCITDDVSSGALGLGRAHQVEIEDWAFEHGQGNHGGNTGDNGHHGGNAGDDGHHGGSDGQDNDGSKGKDSIS